MPRPIPLEDFFRKPERTSVRISPGGTKVAYLAPHARRLNVHVEDLATGAVTRVTSATERDVAGFLWVGEERILYAQDQGGDENYRLYSARADGSGALDLTPFEGVQCDVVDELEDREDEILFQMNQRDPERFDVYRLDVGTGEMTLVAENPGNVQSWMTDHEGRLRLAVTSDGVNTTILYREDETSEWTEVETFDFKETVSPLLFSFEEPHVVWVSTNVGRDRAVIARYDLRAAAELEVVFEHPKVDVTGLLSSRVRRKVTGVTFEEERPGTRFFDEERALIQRRIDRLLPDTVNRLASWTRDEAVYVVAATSDRNRAAYHLFDVRTGELRHLFAASPWIDPSQMAEARPISFRSRDGLEIHGYLTVPPGSVPRGLPLVLLVHGGPWWRDTWGYDPEVQFLANRGYAVLQVNFRGSTGYGREFWSASFGEWGLAMQDDLTDAVRWAAREGIADPKRIAIYGGSYGGYAALSGLTRTPELFACGISFVGVSNLFTWIAAIPPYWKPYLEMLHEMVGHPERDEERFRATSPFFHAEKIRAPLLVAQGANDPRVRKEESDQIVQALRDRGVPVRYLVKENEGHGFANEENQFEFYAAVEAFLAEHLGS